MANYYESARTNYFLVKDIDAFKEDLEMITSSTSLEIYIKHKDLKDYVCLLGSEQNGFPFDYYDNLVEDYLGIDWGSIFAKHLKDDSVAIIIGSGAEKLRYVTGYAYAFNNKGETKSIDLVKIYELAESLGSDVQRAEY